MKKIKKSKNNQKYHEAIPVTQINAVDAAADNFFGVSCSLSYDGSVLAVGAIDWEGTCTNQGCVYVYDWDGSTWVQRSQVTAADAAAYDYFGASCSLSSDGSILAVGAIGWEGSYVSQGCVYIFDWNGSEWIQRNQVATIDAPADNFFGVSCSLSYDGSVLAVGAIDWRGAYASQGCVYIYDWDGSTWVQRSQVTAVDADAMDYFGASCSLSDNGSILAVGATGWKEAYESQGCVYIFDWNGGEWVQRNQVATIDADAMDYFGRSCSLSSDGSILAVGAIGWKGTYTNQGCVYHYTI